MPDGWVPPSRVSDPVGLRWGPRTCVPVVMVCAHGSTVENHLGFRENQRPSRLPDLSNSFHYHSPSSLCTFWPPSRERTLVKMPGCAVVMGISLSLAEENPGNKRQTVENGFVALLHFEKIT